MCGPQVSFRGCSVPPTQTDVRRHACRDRLVMLRSDVRVVLYPGRDTFLLVQVHTLYFPCTYIPGTCTRVVQLFFVVYNINIQPLEEMVFSILHKSGSLKNDWTAPIECMSSGRAVAIHCSLQSVLLLAARYVLSERTHALVNHGPRLAR